MTTMIVTWVVIVAAAVLMLIKRPLASIGYIYAIIVGLMLAGKFLYPYAVVENEIPHCLTLGGGIGAAIGLICAIAISLNKGVEIGAIAASLILAPIIEFIIGFIVIVVLGLGLMIQDGKGGMLTVSSLLTFALVSAMIGGGGSILLIFIKD